MTNRARIVRGTIGVAGVVAVAELVSRAGFADTSLPPASSVLLRAAEFFGDTEFLTAVGSTLEAWILGLLLATVVAVAVGIALSTTPWLNRATRVLVEFMRPIPSVALIPLAIVSFSSITESKVSLVFYSACWPILINTLYALRDVDPLAKETLRSFGFGKAAILLRVSVPSAAPFVATGVRISAAVGLVVVVSFELVAGNGEGIGGYLLQTQSGGGRPDLMLAGAIWAGMLGALINVGLVALERRTFRWHAVRTEASA